MTYETYWAQVLGAKRSAADVVADFELVGADGLDEWLGQAESDAIAMGAEGTLEDYAPFHARALAEIQREADPEGT